MYNSSFFNHLYSQTNNRRKKKNIFFTSPPSLSLSYFLSIQTKHKYVTNLEQPIQRRSKSGMVARVAQTPLTLSPYWFDRLHRKGDSLCNVYQYDMIWLISVACIYHIIWFEIWLCELCMWSGWGSIHGASEGYDGDSSTHILSSHGSYVPTCLHPSPLLPRVSLGIIQDQFWIGYTKNENPGIRLFGSMWLIDNPFQLLMRKYPATIWMGIE